MFSLARLCILITFGSSSRWLLHAEEPSSFETRTGKLPKNIVPIRYSIELAPDLDQATFFEKK